MPLPEGASSFEHSGIRTFHLPGPERTTAALLFRVGHADEPVRLRGVTHLVEHLALSSIGMSTALSYNGSVDMIGTVFHANGEPAEVGDFIGRVSAAISDLPVDRFETEIRVLEAEDRNRPTTTYEAMLADLFGPNGPGAAAFEEIGLHWIGVQEAVDWRNAVFNSSNVRLLVGGPLPDFEVVLPSGEPLEPTLPPPDVGIRPSEPTRIKTQDSGVCVGAIVSRGTPVLLGSEVLRMRLMDKLRLQLGFAYQVGVSYVPLTRSDAFLFVGGDCDPGRVKEYSSHFKLVIDDLVSSGPTRSEVELAGRRLTEWATAPSEFSGFQRLVGHAWDDLLGTKGVTPEEIRQLSSDVDLEEVRSDLETAFSRGAWIADPSLGGLGDRPRREDTALEGKRFRSQGFSRRFLRPGGQLGPADISELIIGKEGLSAISREQTHTLLLNDMVMIRNWSDTEIVITCRSGRALLLNLQQWPNRGALRRELSALLPKALDVPTRRGDSRSWRHLAKPTEPLDLSPHREGH